MQETIKFYSKIKEYREFSNFYHAPFVIDKKQYSTSQHYFQSQKFIKHPEYQQKIINAKSPGAAAKLGKSRKIPIIQNWQQIKENIMYKGLYAKFTTHLNLKQLLLSTGKITLVQHTKFDRYWGDGGDGSGKNRLGVLLMRLRDELKKQQKIKI